MNGEVVITFDYRAMGPNPFGFLLVPLRSIYAQNMSCKASEHFGYLPRKEAAVVSTAHLCMSATQANEDPL